MAEENDRPDTDTISGRPAEEWEKPGIEQYKLAKRAEAAALVSGIRPYASSPDQHWPEEEPDAAKKPKRSRLF